MTSIIAKTLTIKDNFMLNSEHEIVKAVINDETIIETLIVEGTANAFSDDFSKSESFERFWKKLGATVLCLKLHVRPPVEQELYFTNLQKLFIINENIFEFISLTLHQVNVGLTHIKINTEAIDCVTNHEKPEINENFIAVLQHCKSLSNLVFGCKIPLETNIINAIFSELNYNIWEMDELIFDCEQLPFWADYANYYWMVDIIEMRFFKIGNFRKVIVSPNSVCEKLMEGQSHCETNCSLKHPVFRGEGEVTLSFGQMEWKCNEYYRSCFDSFPLIIVLNRVYFNDVDVLNRMSEKLILLRELTYFYYGPLILNWPPFPKLEKLHIQLDVSSYESFENLIKSCPNLKRLRVKIREGITDD